MTKRTDECRVKFPETDPVIESNYTPYPFTKASTEAGAFIDLVQKACERNVEATKSKFGKSAVENLRVVLNGGYLGVTVDKARHFTGAFKLDTLEVVEGYADLLTFNIEAHGSHTGDYLVTIVPTITQQRYYCLPCAEAVLLTMEESQRYYLPTSVSAQCHTCKNVAGEGALVKVTSHIMDNKTPVDRRCKCPGMNLRGVIVGLTTQITPQDVVTAIRALRGQVSTLANLKALTSPVKAQEQHDSNVKTALNIWTGENIKRNKDALLKVSI